jgi:hypothetical protein
MVQFIAIAHVNLIIVHNNGTSAVQPVQFISMQKCNKNETYVFYQVGFKHIGTIFTRKYYITILQLRVTDVEHYAV